LSRSVKAEKQIGLTPVDILARRILIDLKDGLDCLPI